MQRAVERERGADSKLPLREIGEKKKKEERRRRKKQHWGRGAARVLPGQGWTVASSVRATGVPKAGAPLVSDLWSESVSGEGGFCR